MAGFEGADHVNGLGEPLDMVASNGHPAQLDADYRRVARMGLRTVRESIGWRLTERGRGRFDFSRAMRCMEAADRHGIQIVWTLMHYGTPDDVGFHDADFAARFVEFATAAVDALKALHDQPPVYNPINEIGFLAWAASETNLLHRYQCESTDRSTASGFETKCRLARASLMAIKEMRQVDPRIRILHVEPVVHVAPPADRPDLAGLAQQVRDYQWQSWDLLSGRLLPELGGHAEALDLMGVNHYASGQWEVETEDRLHWHLDDQRRLPLSDLLDEVWRRYRRPLIVAETSHVGEGRARWIDDVGASASATVARGVPLHGVCLYPAIDRRDWSDASHWHKSGLWDVEEGGGMTRRLNLSYAKALRRWQRRLPSNLRDATDFYGVA